MKLEAACYSHIGRREQNEDAALASLELGVFVVADGMGGYEGGEIASRIAIETVVDFARRNAADDDCTWPYPFDPGRSLGENQVAVAARLADARIAQQRRGHLDRMGSTLALLWVHDREAVIGHVGDSRVYRLRAGVLEALTVDHSLYAMLAASGTPGLPPRSEFAHGNVITQALGMANAHPDLRREALWPGDIYLLCTDGLSEMVPEEVIAETLMTWPLDAACSTLVAEAYARGGRDNITALLVRVAA